MNVLYASSFFSFSVFQLLNRLGLFSYAVDVSLDAAGKWLRLNQNAEFIAVADSHAGQIRAAEQDLVAVDQDDLLVHGAVFLDEADLDSVVLQSMGVIQRGIPNGHGSALAEFGDHERIQSGPGLFADGVVDGLDGFMAAAADEIGQNPDARAGGLDGFLDGFAKGFGGEEPDGGGIAGVEIAGDAVEVEVGPRLLGRAIYHVAHGPDGHVGHHGRGWCLDQGAVGIGGFAHNVAGQDGPVAHVEGVELGEGGGGKT